MSRIAQPLPCLLLHLAWTKRCTRSTCSPLSNFQMNSFSLQVVDMEDPEYYYGAIQYKDGSWATTK